MADTLANVATDELTAATQAEADAAAALAAAQATFVTARTNLDTATDDFRSLNDAAAGIRRQIAQTTVAADGDALFVQLETKFVEIREKQKQIADLQEAFNEAQSAVAAAQDAVSAAAVRLTAATAAKADADKREADLTAWRTAVTTAPLSGLPQTADVTQPGDAQTAMSAALKRVDESVDGSGDLPHELVGLAAGRRSSRRERLDVIVRLAGESEQRQADAGATAGLAGKTEQARVAFEQVEAALKEFALTGSSRYQRALALLAGVAAGTPLSADEKQKLQTLSDTAKNDAGGDAFVLTTAVITAQTSVDEQQDKIDKSLLDASAADPTANPQPDANDVTELQNRQGALTTVEGNVTANMTAELLALDNAVPDASWAVLDDYEEALAILADLAKVNTATLAATATEEAYAAAIRAERVTEGSVVKFAGLARQSADRANAYAPTRPARLLSALRGDA